MEKHRPGVPVENWRLFEPRIDIKTGKEVGFVDPEGNYYTLKKGEELVFGEDRKPMIRKTDGQEISFEEWKNNKIKAEQLVPAELLNKLDPECIKDLISQTTGKNERNGGSVLFGNDFSLEDNHREQLRTVVEIVESFLRDEKEKPEWEELQKLIKEGEDKGILIDFANNPPKWLVDGGETSTVKKVRLANNLPGIQVPSRILKTYKWDVVVNHIKDIETSGPNVLKGRSAKSLGTKLEELLDLFEKNNLI
ncbi:MAG: hypothetical protein ACOXZY_02505 [Patescibacteria group bacterium]|jgi:hypothetical protein